jgi:hypothetical protein
MMHSQISILLFMMHQNHPKRDRSVSWKELHSDALTPVAPLAVVLLVVFV